MSLNSWSLVYFCTQAMFFFSIYFAMFSKTSPAKFLAVFIVWLIQLFITLIYGMSTQQIGFVLMFFLEIAMVMFVYTITGKMKYNEDKQSQ